MNRLALNISAKYRARHCVASTASVCRIFGGPQEAFAAEKCAQKRAKNATKEII